MADSLREKKIEFDDLIKYPEIEEVIASLRPMEKIMLGQFMMLVRPRIILELGVWQAKTTQFMYNFMLANNIDAKIYGFDMPFVVEKLNSDDVVLKMQADGRLSLIPGALPDSLKAWTAQNKPQIDLVLIDAYHDYPSVVSELRAIWPYLSPEGVILCHDYEYGPENQHEGVIYAVHKFASRHKDAMLLSLRSSKEADQYLFEGQYDLMFHSVLVGLRKQPFALQSSGWLRHWYTELNWWKPRILYRIKHLLGLSN
ncbi:MAG: class I SAM-dependent methyltransferase [Aggregatilineales bacterium]